MTTTTEESKTTANLDETVKAKANEQELTECDEKQEEKVSTQTTDAPAGDNNAEDELELEVEVEVEGKDTQPDPMAALQAKVEELEAAKKSNYERLLRSTADLENFRKRARKDVKDGRLDERSKILRDMLPVIDNLERAMEHAGQQSKDEASKGIVEGVTLVLRQFSQALIKHKVDALDALGTAFDPARHEAVSQAPSEEYAPGTVCSVLQKGYMVEERLLRPALVVVAIAMPTPVETETSEEVEEGTLPEDAETVVTKSERASTDIDGSTVAESDLDETSSDESSEVVDSEGEA